MRLGNRHWPSISRNRRNFVRLIHVIRINPVGEDLGEVAGLAAGEVLDLLPAGNASAAISLSVVIESTRADLSLAEVCCRNNRSPIDYIVKAGLRAYPHRRVDMIGNRN
jgi:hypothetical protein